MVVLGLISVERQQATVGVQYEPGASKCQALVGYNQVCGRGDCPTLGEFEVHQLGANVIFFPYTPSCQFHLQTSGLKVRHGDSSRCSATQSGGANVRATWMDHHLVRPNTFMPHPSAPESWGRYVIGVHTRRKFASLFPFCRSYPSLV